MRDEPNSSVGGDTDQWILFERFTSDGYPLVVLSRTNSVLIDQAWKTSVMTVVHCRAELQDIAEHGMPQNSDRLYPVEEAIAKELEAFDIGAFHVASITGDGERKMVYLHRSPLSFDPILAKLHAEGFSLSASSPRQVEAIRDLVIPTLLDRQLNGDMGVISNLESHGDDGLTSRKTEFWFFGTREGAEALVQDLRPWGFAVERWLSEPEGVLLSLDTPVNFAVFKDLTPVLVGAAEKHDLVYDGWETLVMIPDQKLPATQIAPKPSLLSKLFGAKKN